MPRIQHYSELSRNMYVSIGLLARSQNSSPSILSRHLPPVPGKEKRSLGQSLFVLQELWNEEMSDLHLQKSLHTCVRRKSVLDDRGMDTKRMMSTLILAQYLWFAVDSEMFMWWVRQGMAAAKDMYKGENKSNKDQTKPKYIQRDDWSAATWTYRK